MLPYMFPQIDARFIGSQDNIDQYQVYILVFQHFLCLFIYDYIVDNFISDFLQHRLHVVGDNDIIFYDKNFNRLLQGA